jgi:hypothetical protein
MEALLVQLLKIGGISALAVGVFYLLYKQFMSLGIFAKLGRGQTFSILLIVVVLVWLLAVSTLLGQNGFNFVFGSSGVRIGI